MNLLRIYFCILMIISPFLVSAITELENEIPAEKNCGSNFFPYQIGSCCEPKNKCAYISHERLNWDDAKFRCKLLFAELTQQIHFKSSLRNDLLKRGIDILWIGIRRRNNFFITEYPSKLFREVDSFSPDYWGYHWADNEPGTEDCVALNTTSGSLITRCCSDNLPFVCDAAENHLNATTKYLACPEGWNLSFPLSSSGRTCISLQEPNTHENAEEICGRNDGRLATFVEYTTLSYTNYFSAFNRENFWINKKTFKICQVIRSVNGLMNKTFPTSCNLKYPFVCVQNFKKESIRVYLSPESIQPVESDSRGAVDILTCNVENEFSDLNTETDLDFQWYKDDIPISVNSYVVRLSFLGDVLKRDAYESDIASRQGYYHCEVQLPGSNETYSSSKMKFYYTDIASYFIEIHGMKQKNDFDYSHQHFSEYMEEFDEASINNVIKDIPYSTIQWDFVSKSVLNGEAIMEIVFYIYKNGIEDFDERMACEDLKDAFINLYSIPTFMNRMSVYIDCEEIPIRNGQVQTIKRLKNIEAELNQIENNQERILFKLREYESSRNDDDFDDEYDDDYDDEFDDDFYKRSWFDFDESYDDYDDESFDDFDDESSDDFDDETFDDFDDVFYGDFDDESFDDYHGKSVSNFDVEVSLNTVFILKKLFYRYLHTAPKVGHAEKEHDQHEKNEYEENPFAVIGKTIFSELKEQIKTVNRNLYLELGGSVKERNENYVYYPGKERKRATSKKGKFLKDL